MVNFKENDTVVCSKSTSPWITQFKVYTIQTSDEGKLAVCDDLGTVWALEDLTEIGNIFTLITAHIFRKEKDEYLKLATALEEAERLMNKTNELITLTRIDETTLYVNISHIAAFYHNKAWEYTIVILSDGTQLDVKDSVESIAKYF
jgi:hypothetical protein|nr:MAG TPA: Flagellar and Swarming motility protein [Caudoviricetes sp.]